MSTVLDIPERDGQDGAAQLAYLRSYLKDTEIGNYTYSDDLLIELLVETGRVAVWKDLTGYLGETPWGYTTTAPISYESRIRMLTGDTDEGALRYTDYDLQVFLETIPLRYVVVLINAEREGSVTYPSNDVNNPIYIVRRYLGDTDTNNVKYRDADITKMLFDSRLDPFAFVAEELSRSAGEAVSGSVSAGGNDLASIDGISFSEEEKRTENFIADLDYIRNQAVSSVYHREPVYGFWLEGENLADIEWKKNWYSLQSLPSKIPTIPSSESEVIKRVAALESKDLSQDVKIETLESKDLSQDVKIETLESKDLSQDVKIETLESKDLSQDVKIEDNKVYIDSLERKVLLVSENQFYDAIDETGRGEDV